MSSFNCETVSTDLCIRFRRAASEGCCGTPTAFVFVLPFFGPGAPSGDTFLAFGFGSPVFGGITATSPSSLVAFFTDFFLVGLTSAAFRSSRDTLVAFFANFFFVGLISAAFGSPRDTITVFVFGFPFFGLTAASVWPSSFGASVPADRWLFFFVIA